jgi:hypothetical protein
VSWLRRLRDWWKRWGDLPVGWCGNTDAHDSHVYSIETNVPDGAWGYEHAPYRCPGMQELEL